jgi:hypothetical protein
MEAQLEQAMIEYEDLKSYVVIDMNATSYDHAKAMIRKDYDKAIEDDSDNIDRYYAVYQQKLENLRHQLHRALDNPIAQYALELQERIYTLSLEVKATSHGNIHDVVSCKAAGFDAVDNNN